MAKHILSVLVENNSGVLSRVSGLFSRRGFNIHSLAVGVTEKEGISRMTIVVDGDDYVIEQVEKQLNKLIEVLKIKQLDKDDSVEREVALIKVNTNSKTKSEVIQIVEIFKAKVVDVCKDSLVIESTGRPAKIEALEDMVRSYGIKEIVRTGTIAMQRGFKSIEEKAIK